MVDKERDLKHAMIKIGQQLYQKGLVAAYAGNLSARLDQDNLLITATGVSLGALKDKEMIKVNLTKEITHKNLSTEFPLHRLIYKNFSQQTVIHCHPPLINGYFAVNPSLKALTFETRLYLGNVPVIEQETPAVTNPQLVVDALKTNNLVVLKNHGVVAIADKFTEALALIETLEEAVRVAAIARLFKQEALDELDQRLKETLSKEDETLSKSAQAYPMFSREHIQAIVELANKDEFIAQKGEELDLTTRLAIKLEGTDKVYKFNFAKGKIIKIEFDADAPFVISAPFDVWETIFLGRLDPFVATTQGRMKLQGRLGELSRWYVPFSRLFELFKQVKIK